MSEALAREHPECYVQTHVSESLGEIELARELYPNLPDYVGIYERYRLLGPKTLLGHANVVTTEIYTHVSRDHIRAAHRRSHPRA